MLLSLIWSNFVQYCKNEWNGKTGIFRPTSPEWSILEWPWVTPNIISFSHPFLPVSRMTWHVEFLPKSSFPFLFRGGEKVTQQTGKRSAVTNSDEDESRRRFFPRLVSNSSSFGHFVSSFGRSWRHEFCPGKKMFFLVFFLLWFYNSKCQNDQTRNFMQKFPNC